VIRPLRAGDLAELRRMQQALWPDSTDDEAAALIGLHPFRAIVLVAERPDGGLAGFAELATRSVADGCHSSPVAYLEGIWVDADARRQGVASALVARAIEWAKSWGLSELASDCLIDNEASRQFHAANGFETLEEVVQFRRDLAGPPASGDERRPPTDLTIRPATPKDHDAIWAIFHEVVARGDTYAYDPATPRDAALHLWVEQPQAVFVAETAGRIVGTYNVRPNQPGLGNHVCNAGYMVAAAARSLGVGEAMCRHSLDEARRLGYTAMQYNLVVATNVGAVRLWKRMGFDIVGTLPGAFRHAERGPVDAVVMFRRL
jgi:GNAT superfamily N-acetyltransferase